MSEYSHHEPFNEGEFFFTSFGEYSDYTVSQLFRVLKPFKVQDFVTKKKRNSWAGEQKTVDIEKLENENYIEPLISRELWLGSWY